MSQHKPKSRRFLKQLPRGPFWTYFTAALFFNFGFALFAFLFNVYLIGLGYNERTLGLMGSCALTGRFLATLPIAWVAQRFGLRATLFTAVAFAIAVTFCRITFPAVITQLPLAFLAGLMLCTWGVCLPPAIAALTTEDRRPFAFSLIFASGIGDAGFGAFAAGHLPGWFAAHLSATPTQSERLTLYTAIAVAAIALIPLARLRLPATEHSPLSLFVFRRHPRAAGDGPPHSANGEHEPALSSQAHHSRLFLAPALSPFLKRFLPATAVWAIVLGAFPPFANVFFTKHLHLQLRSMGSVLSAAQGIQFAAILLAPFLFRRMSLANGILVTQLLTAIGLLSLGGSHTLLAASCSYWFFTAAQNSNEPAIASLLMDSVPAADRNSASSFATLATAGAQILASTAVGVSIVRFGYPPVLYTIAALSVLAAVLFYRLPKPHPQST